MEDANEKCCSVQKSVVVSKLYKGSEARLAAIRMAQLQLIRNAHTF